MIESIPPMLMIRYTSEFGPLNTKKHITYKTIHKSDPIPHNLPTPCLFNVMSPLFYVPDSTTNITKNKNPLIINIKLFPATPTTNSLELFEAFPDK